MPLADHAPTITKKNRCGIAKLELADDDLQVLRDWCDDPTIYDTKVAESLNKYTGATIGYQVVARHRLRQCGCYQ
jgi:hypothetical protein